LLARLAGSAGKLDRDVVGVGRTGGGNPTDEGVGWYKARLPVIRIYANILRGVTVSHRDVHRGGDNEKKRNNHGEKHSGEGGGGKKEKKKVG